MARPRTLCDIKIGLKAAAFSITLARGHHLFYGQLVNPMKSHFRRLRSNWLPKGREESNVDSFFLEPKRKAKVVDSPPTLASRFYYHDYDSRSKVRYSRDAEWIFELASLSIRSPNFPCAVILSFLRSTYRLFYDMLYTIGVLICTTSSFVFH